MFKTSSILLVFLLCPLLLHAQEHDVQGSKDHPLFSRVPGSTIIQYSHKEFDEVVLPLGRAFWLKQAFEDQKRVTGEVYRIGYKIPSGRSTLAVIHSYKQALKEGHAEILYACSGEKGDGACGVGFATLLNKLPGEGSLFGTETIDDESQRYLAARMERDGQTLFVMVFVYYQYGTETPYIRLRTVATGAEQEQLVTLTADVIKQGLDETGHMIIEGIYFDTGKANIRPESEAVLREMATVLNSNPDLKVFIVGHTDDTGAFAYNMQLSQRRAEAVAKYLIENLHVDPARIQPEGVGPLAPVASNRTETGRQKNRRVEMVKRIN